MRQVSNEKDAHSIPAEYDEQRWCTHGDTVFLITRAGGLLVIEMSKVNKMLSACAS